MGTVVQLKNRADHADRNAAMDVKNRAVKDAKLNLDLNAHVNRDVRVENRNVHADRENRDARADHRENAAVVEEKEAKYANANLDLNARVDRDVRPKNRANLDVRVDLNAVTDVNVRDVKDAKPNLDLNARVDAQPNVLK